MKKNALFPFVLGVVLFLSLLISKIIRGQEITFKTLIPAFAGGLVGGLVVYFVGNWLSKSKKNEV
ncbi:MAG TPA: hypothetical protein VFN30_11890 [Chitinophagaceae bacterium]|nr:hypothetical protein [Chitinophagaceae bacterium]